MKKSIFLVKNFIKKAVIKGVIGGLAFASLFHFHLASVQATEMDALRRDFNLKQGASFSTNIVIQRYDDWPGPIPFSVSGGNRVTTSINPNPATGNSSRITFTAASNAPLGMQYINVTGTAGRDVRRMTFEINVTPGTTTGPRLSVNPTSVSFPATLIGQTPAVQNFTISNSGSGTTALNISAVSLSGADASQFSINASLCQGRSLAAGASCAVSVAAASPAAARAFNASITIAASTGSVSVPLSLQGTDFLLSASPASVGLNPGGSVTLTLTANRNVNSAAQATGAIAVTTAALPAGVSASALTIANGASTGTITLTALSTAVPTSVPTTLTFTGNLSGRTKTANASLSVQAPGTFTLSATPNPISINQGSSGSVSVAINRTSFTSSITLSATGLPTGVTATSPSTSGNSSTLSLTVATTATAGTYPIVIRGVSGSTTQTTGLSLVVRALPADFSLSVSPSSVTLNAGSSATFTANLNRTNFTSAVNFTLSGLPSGVSGSCPSTSGNSASCSLTAAASATAGTSSVTIQASGGSINKTATLSLRVGSSGLSAFPGAEGFGAVSTTGGRGGTVCKVTNLSRSGAGSFQACMDLTGPAYIVFTVSGIVRDGSIECHYGNKTIAGQTSPAGIIIRGFEFDDVYEANPNCNNIIVRHLRSRPAAGTLSASGWISSDGTRLDGMRNIVLDHMSFERASDEAFQLSRSNNITIQNSIFAETLSDHYWGGMLMNYSTTSHDQDKISIHHNMWTGIQARFPEISCEENGDDRIGTSNCTNKRMQLELSNNMIYDPTDPIWYNRCTGTNAGNDCAASGPSFFVDMNWVGNYMRDRSGSDNSMMSADLMNESRNDVYYADNYRDVGLAALLGFSAPSLGARFDYPEITYTPGSDIPNYMIANVGAFPRDAMDQRLVGYLSQDINSTPTATGSRPNDTFTTLAPSCTPLSTANDTDNDGMNDNWERRNGLNVGIQDHNGTTLSSDGYTNIEVYLNELSDRVVAAGTSTSGICD